MRRLTIVAAALFAAAPARAEFSFVVIGDTPYGAADERMLEIAVDQIERRRPPFVIHLGDIKGGRAPCDGAADDAFAELIDEMKPIPVFATPGDNEWTDCDRNDDPQTGGPYSDMARLAELRARFHAGPAPGGAALKGERQQGQFENQRWSFDGVLFALIHAVGTDDGLSFVNGDPLEAATAETFARREANAAWIAGSAKDAKESGAKALVFALQADVTDVAKANIGKPCAAASDKLNRCDAFLELRAAFREAAAAFGGPVLVIHGDTAPFTLNQDFLDGGEPNLWRLNAAGDAGVGSTGFGYGVRDVTLVTFKDGARAPFAAKGLVGGKLAKAKG